MSKSVRVYVKKQLRLDLLTLSQRKMYEIGMVGLDSIKKRVARGGGPNDGAAPALRSNKWKAIKLHNNLKPFRDLHGTGLMWPEKEQDIEKRRAQKTWDKRKLKKVGHLMEQLTVRGVSDTRAVISVSTRAGRKKAAGNRKMLGFSPRNNQDIARSVYATIKEMKGKMVKTFMRGGK
jgi:hypothetical protein